MNEQELDRLLDAWQPPAPPASMRTRLQDRFPRRSPRRFRRSLRWLVLVAAGGITLAIAMEDTSRPFAHFYDTLVQTLETWRVTGIRNRIRQRDPRVFVDGQPAPPLEYSRAATLVVQVPEEGTYVITFLSRELRGWVEAGRIHHNVIEFQAGDRHVRIECNRTVVDSDRPVFVRRLQTAP